MQSTSLTASTAQQRVAGEIRAHLARQRRKPKDLAEALDISPATVSRWLNGKAPITIDTAERIATYLDVPIGALFIEQKVA